MFLNKVFLPVNETNEEERLGMNKYDIPEIHIYRYRYNIYIYTDTDVANYH